jgi:hypothetical protein
MQDYWLFVFATAPDVPIIVQAVFPPEMEEEALEFVNDGNGYRTIRKSTWRFGRVPEYGDTLPL